MIEKNQGWKKWQKKCKDRMITEKVRMERKYFTCFKFRKRSKIEARNIIEKVRIKW